MFIVIDGYVIDYPRSLTSTLTPSNGYSPLPLHLYPHGTHRLIHGPLHNSYNIKIPHVIHIQILLY